MKSYFLLLFFISLPFCSCSKQVTKENNDITVCDTVIVNLDSIKNEILALKEKLNLSISDTIKYQFALEDFGSQGNEGTAYYLNDSIYKIEFDVYTCMLVYNLFYLFDNKHIKITERTYNIANVYSGGDMELIKTLSYSINCNGIPVNEVDSNRIDIFQELKQVVPFVLK